MTIHFGQGAEDRHRIDQSAGDPRPLGRDELVERLRNLQDPRTEAAFAVSQNRGGDSRRRFLAGGAALVAGTVVASATTGTADAATLQQPVYGSTTGIPAWTASTAYVVNQLVSFEDGVFICATKHTSGSSFPGVGTDWQLLSAPVQSVYIDAYGADNTGATNSDSAWTAAYTAAVNLLKSSSTTGATSGVVIEFGPGIYTFAVNVLKITNAQIGIKGQGKGVTTIQFTGSSGTGLYASNVTPQSGSTPDVAGAPVKDFTLYGGGAGSSVIGFHYGDRTRGFIEIEVMGFEGTGSSNILFRNDLDSNAGCEGTICRIHTQSGGTSLVTFDGNNEGGSFDYSDWWFHCVAGTVTQDFVVCQIINQGHLNGGKLTLLGNTAGDTSSGTSVTSAVLTVGASTSDTAAMGQTEITVKIECDAGTVSDLNIAAESYAGGIQECYGAFVLLPAAGTVKAGVLAGAYQAQLFGLLESPIFSTAGTALAKVSHLSIWSSETTQSISLNSDSGAITPGSASGIGVPEYSGTGAPSSSNPVSSPAQGSRYWRYDTPGTANQRLYICTVGGTSPTWVGIL